MDRLTLFSSRAITSGRWDYYGLNILASNNFLECRQIGSLDVRPARQSVISQFFQLLEFVQGGLRWSRVRAIADHQSERS